MEVKVTIHFWPDLLAFAILITLMIHHLMLFWGRKKDQREKYNLNFACFVFSISIFIISRYLREEYFLNELCPSWLNVTNIEMISIWMMTICGILFFSKLLEISSKFRKNFRFTLFTISADHGQVIV